MGRSTMDRKRSWSQPGAALQDLKRWPVAPKEEDVVKMLSGIVVAGSNAWPYSQVYMGSGCLWECSGNVVIAPWVM